MSTPDSLPLLSPGTHLSPDDGACLMELVSVLAAEPWSDQPACTDPTLATIARVVNDDMSDATRQAIVPLAADLVGRTGDPVHLAPHLVDLCLTVTQRHLPAPSPRLERHRRRAARRLAADHRLGVSLPAWLYARGPAQHAITAMILALRALPAADRDRALQTVLHAAVAAATQRPVAAPHLSRTLGRMSSGSAATSQPERRPSNSCDGEPVEEQPWNSL